MASYTTVLALALAGVPDARLSLRDLYLYVEKHAHLLPFTSRQHWRRSVRHTLSKQPCFSRVDNNGETADASARRCLWIMDEPRLPQPTREVLKQFRSSGSATAAADIFASAAAAASTGKAAAAAAAEAADRGYGSHGSSHSGSTSGSTSGSHRPALAQGVRAPLAAAGTAMTLSGQAPLDPQASSTAAAAAMAQRGVLPQQAPLAGGTASSALLSAMLNGSSGDAMVQQPMRGAAHQHHQQHQHHHQQQQQREDPMSLLSGWATLAGFSPEEVSSALASAMAAAEAESQRQRELERQKKEQARQQQQQLLFQQQQQQQAAHDPQAQDYYNMIMQSFGSLPGNNAQSLQAMAVATADMAATRPFAELGAGSYGSQPHSGTRDSGLGQEMEDDLQFGGAAMMDRQAMPDNDSTQQDYLMQQTDMNFIYGDDAAMA